LNLQDTLALIFCAIIPLGLVGGIIVSISIEREQGKEAAEKYNIPILLAIGTAVLLTLLLNLLFSILAVPTNWLTTLQYVLSAVLAAALILNFIQQRRAAARKVHLEVGKARSKSRFFLGGIAGLVYITYAVQMESRAGFNPDLTANALMWLLITLTWLASVHSKVYVNEGGISFSRFSTIKWDNISRYTWAGRNKDKVFLYLEGGGKLDFIASEKNRERLDEIIRARVKNLKFEEQL
jgi:hypothetical protein